MLPLENTGWIVLCFWLTQLALWIQTSSSADYSVMVPSEIYTDKAHSPFLESQATRNLHNYFIKWCMFSHPDLQHVICQHKMLIKHLSSETILSSS